MTNLNQKVLRYFIKKVGMWKTLYDNGKVWKEQNWEGGEMISEKCWDENGIEMQCK